MFDINDAMRFNDAETVDAEFSSILAEINYTADVWEPGVTYSDDIEERAGQLFIRKLGKGTVVGTDATSAGGLDFTAVQTGDELIPLIKNATLAKSEKIYTLIDNARKSGKLAEKEEVVVRTHGEAWQGQVTALLLGDEDNFTEVAAPVALTADNVVDQILATQQQILESDADADVVIVSPACRSLLLTNNAKGKGFLPETNEDAKRKGIIGDLLGMKVKVTNFLGKASSIATKITPKDGEALLEQITDGAEKAKKTAFLVLDHKTFRVVTTILGAASREVKGELGFFGTIASMQSISGAKNTNPERCIVYPIAG